MNRFLMRYSQPMMWAAVPFIIAGIVFHHLISMPYLAMPCFLIGTILTGFPVLWRGFQGLRYKTVGIEVLVSIAVIGALLIREFSEAAIVCFLFQFGSWLEQITMRKTRSAIKELTEMAPVTACRVDEEGFLEEIDVDEVEVSDILLVKTGEQIPVDGIVTEGEGHVNEASITGEPIPKSKRTGDPVYAGTILHDGMLRMEAVKVGEDTTFARIIEMVEEAQDAKSPEERFIDRFAKYYTPFVVLLADIVLLLLRDIDTAITVLVLACPGALVIGAPIANVAGIGKGAREGVLLKGGDSVHTFVKTDTFIFDKTGTLTEGCPTVVKTEVPYDIHDDTPQVLPKKQLKPHEEQLIQLIASAEQASTHPLAQAIVRYCESLNISLLPPVDARVIKGMGLEAEIEDKQLLIGNERLMRDHRIAGPEAYTYDRDAQNNTVTGTHVYAAINGMPVMRLLIEDAVKKDAADSLRQLKKMGIKSTVLLTGDNRRSAEHVGMQLGIDEIYAELLPEDKLTIIRDIQGKGHTVTFVGDGINDSPALTAADTGIAMGSGTDVAIDSSDVVLIRSDLQSMVKALALSKRTVRILRQNIVIAVGTVILLLIGLFAGYVHMSIGMFLHEASILVVIFNAMRLLR